MDIFPMLSALINGGEALLAVLELSPRHTLGVFLPWEQLDTLKRPSTNLKEGGFGMDKLAMAEDVGASKIIIVVAK